MEQNRSPSAASDSAEEGSRRSFKRNRVACHRCRSHKVKCTGETPCRNCQQSRKPVDCVYPRRDRKVAVRESYIKSLEAENNELKRKRPQELQSDMSSYSSTRQPPSSLSGVLPQSGSATNMSDSIPSLPIYSTSSAHEPAPQASTKFNSDEIALQPMYRGEASSETFGGRLLQYLRNDDGVNRQPLQRPYSYYKNPKLLRISSTNCDLPNKNYAKLLVRAVLRFIGGDHHLLLRKSLLERLEDTYQPDKILDDPVWLCRLFTVFALGELYSRGGTTKKGPGVPGTGFFMRAMGLFQDVHEEPTVSYIETLLLLSFYSIALNRRNTSYTYAGLALRLSLTLGLHRKIPEDSMSAPEREHRIRVWWTCYALDRIYTSKVGLPVTLRDEDIDVQMPSMDGLTLEEAEDFYPPELMTAQIQLARITGNIMSDLYRIPQPGRANTFVQSVQRILSSLNSWIETLPQVLRLDFNAMPIYPSRSVASLQLHFGNAVIQTTRPILFHIFRMNVESSSRSAAPAFDKTTVALAEACIQAARTSASILAQLWVDGCLAPYGYFDAISVFSSTMIIMMSSVMKNDDTNDNDDVETAWSLLRFMKDAGNIPAIGYYDQLVDLKAALDSLKERKKQQNGDPRVGAIETDGLQMLLDASGSVAPRLCSRNGLTAETPDIIAFGVGDSIGPVLDDPFLQDFLHQPYGTWAPESFDSVSGLPVGQFQFDWENANLFGNL